MHNGPRQIRPGEEEAMSLAAELETIADPLREDGADLALERVHDGTARVRLLITDESCAECIMPREHLEGVLLQALRIADATIHAVELIDPREERP
jgi:hypothetical protein